MTPEELNRKMEFIVESQARLAAAQEQDRHDRIQFEEWSRALFARMDARDDRLAQLSLQQARLLEHQSERMDRLDKFYEEWRRERGDFQSQVLDLQRQALHLLHLILDRLPPFPSPS
jgi:uncharacterized protein YecA (UPF0149 family)